MASLTERIISYCILNDIVSVSDEDWLRYGIEKRMMLLMGSIPQTALAVCFSNVPAAIGYMTSFFLLRGKTSGYHAKTPLGCLCISVLLESLFFIGLYSRLGMMLMFICNGLSTIVIFYLAPYAHPNMHFDKAALRALRLQGRSMTLMLFFGAVICWYTGVLSVARGLTIGITMTAFALWLAYFIDWRENKCKRKMKRSTSWQESSPTR